MLSDDGLMRLAAKQAIASNPKILWVLHGLKVHAFDGFKTKSAGAAYDLATW